MHYKRYLKNTKQKVEKPDFKKLSSSTEAKIALSVGLLILAIYGAGKFMRLLGNTIEDAKYLAKTLRK